MRCKVCGIVFEKLKKWEGNDMDNDDILDHHILKHLRREYFEQNETWFNIFFEQNETKTNNGI
jgi:hypothetical protein|tara:strand:- start:1983 stop:2171 length:189 start_codon:yes stop_codon:yes gene_type:complete